MKTPKILKSTWFIPNFSPGLCCEATFKSKSELSDLITVTVLKANRLWDLKFFLISPPIKHKCHGQGANSLQLGFYLPGPDACAKTGGQFSNGLHPGLCAPWLMYVKHTQGSSLQHLDPKAKVSYRESLGKLSKVFIDFQVWRQWVWFKAKEPLIGTKDYSVFMDITVLMVFINPWL